MRVDWKRIFTIATIVIVAGLAVAIWHAGTEIIPQPNSRQEIKEGQVQGRRAQFASWQFTYDSATTLPDQTTQQINGVHDGVFFKNGKPYIRMRADRIVYNTINHDFAVTGPAHFEIDDKGKTRTLDTRDAAWSDAQQTLRAPGDVTVGSEGGARLRLTDVSIDLRTGQFSVHRLSGGATP